MCGDCKEAHFHEKKITLIISRTLWKITGKQNHAKNIRTDKGTEEAQLKNILMVKQNR